MHENFILGLPYTTLTSLTSWIKEMKEFELTVSDVIFSEEHESVDLMYYSHDRRFYFHVQDVYFENGILYGMVTRTPHSLEHNKVFSGNKKLQDVKESATNWVSLIVNYNKALFNHKNLYYDEFEAAYNAEFNIADDTQLLNEASQDKAKLFLNYIAEEIDFEDAEIIDIPEVKEFLAQTNEITENISNLPHSEFKKFMYKAGKFVSKYGKKAGKDLAKKIYSNTIDIVAKLATGHAQKFIDHFISNM